MKETFNQCDAQGVKMSAVIILSSLQLHIKKNHPKVHIRRKHCKGVTVCSCLPGYLQFTLTAASVSVHR